MTVRGLISVPAVIAVLTGCEDPYARDADRESGDARRSAAPLRDERRRGDGRPPLARGRDAAPAVDADARATPRAAVGAFCSQWANWNWRTIERQQLRLARLATGTLARRLVAEARLRAQDEALRRDQLGSRGRVVATAVKRGTSSRDAVCVAREERLAHGRGDPEGASHRVYLATIARTTSGWAVKRWEPQP